MPRITNVESDVPTNYELPRSYVRYHRITDDEWKTTLEYVSEAEDEAWLAKNSKFGGAADVAKVRLPIDLLERMMDALEKETAFDAIVTVGQADALFRNKIPKFYALFPSKPRQGLVTAKHVLNDVYAYWVQKRSKLKRPLLRRFWPVTSTDDTNPHLVFRPREKEKYKLRKKRQNDMDSFRKLKQLHSNFTHLKAIMELCIKREELNRLHLQMQIDLFQQRLYNVIDISGRPRESEVLHKTELKEALAMPKFFDMQGRIAKRPRTSTTPLNVPTSLGSSSSLALTGTPLPAPDGPRSIAGQNHGLPAPHFLQPLHTRESYATTWNDAVPYVETYVDSHRLPTFRYRHRTRIGRGGRVIIDRVPETHEGDTPPLTVFTAGKGLQPYQKPKGRLLDLLPRPLDRLSLSRRVEELCVSAIQEDFEARVAAEPEENDADEVIVRMNDWNDTDGHLWGEERYALGPFEE